MTTSLKTFWFDLGNVILPFDFTPAFKRLARHGADPEAIRRFFKKRPWLESASDKGAVNARAIYRMLRAHFGFPKLGYSEFRTVWNDIFKEDREVSGLVRSLRRRGFRLILVSNTNKLHFDHIRKTYPVMGEFHHHVLSYKEKTRKPEKGIYRRALRLSRAARHEIFYADDRADFTSAAKSYGVHTHTFTHASKLRTALRRHGVEV